MIHHKRDKEITTIKEEAEENSSLNSDEEEKKDIIGDLKLVYKRSNTRVDRTAEEFNKMTPAQNKIYEKVASVISQAKSFKNKIRALEEEKNSWNTKDLEDYILKSEELSSPVKSMSGKPQRNRKLTEYFYF